MPADVTASAHLTRLKAQNVLAQQPRGNAMRRKLTIAASAAAAALLIATTIHAQQPAATPPPITQGAANIKRTPLQKFDVPGTNMETVIGIAEVVANVNIGRHTHPGPESGYMLEGEMVLLIDGQPPRPLKAGDSYTVPAGAIHDGKSGPKGAKVIATYVVEKGKPLATPAK
jgi:quercetin dioxygenase-like cupin family protein